MYQILLYRCTEISPCGAYIHSSKDRQTNIHIIYIHYYKQMYTYILLGSSRSKIKQGMGRESDTEVLFFCREIGEVPPKRLHLGRVLDEMQE